MISAKVKNGQKQVKKKAFKINAKIEDVGLNEDLKSTETRNGHYIFMINQNLKILHTASFFFKSELSVSSWSIPALTTIKENNSCTDHLEWRKQFLHCQISG